MRYIITGASSFIGTELVAYLLRHGHTVTAVCRPGSKGQSKLPQEVETVGLEMKDYDRLGQHIPGADIFVNLAWGGTGHSGRDIADIQKDNITYTKAAMAEAAKMGCRLFVEAGSQAEYGSTTCPQTEDMPCAPFSEYGRAKLKIKEELFRLSEITGIKYIHLRIFSIIGENDHPWTLVSSAIDRMLRNEPVDLSPCTQNWNFLYVKDAARQICTLCDKAINDPYFRHEIYNIASDDTRQLKCFVERMKELTGSASPLNYGAVSPQNHVSLQPDMDKTRSAVGILNEFSFDETIHIIRHQPTIISNNNTER